ncbi:MAG TPA: hypothetical protein VGM19_13205 [Armatimonadota bacterium]|jgi:hypothetical protein
MAEVSETQQREPGSGQAWGNYGVGLLVFVAGVALMLLAFYWGYLMLKTVDEQIQRVQVTKPVATPATTAAPKAAAGKETKPAEVAVAKPTTEGPTLIVVAVGAVLKLVILLVLAAIGGMTASRGAQLAQIRVH